MCRILLEGYKKKKTVKKNSLRDFHGGPVVKNQPSNAQDRVPSQVRELRPHLPQGSYALDLHLTAHVIWSPQAAAEDPGCLN